MRESKVHVYIIHSLKTLRKMTILFLIFPKASRGAVCLLLLDDSLQDTGINVCGKKNNHSGQKHYMCNSTSSRTKFKYWFKNHSQRK